MSTVVRPMTAAVVLAAGFVLTGCGQSVPGSAQAGSTSAKSRASASAAPVSPVPASSKPLVSKPVTTTRKAKPDGRTLGPDGYLELAIGTSAEVAWNLGFVRDRATEENCTSYDMLVNDEPDGYVFISAARGVEAIAPDNATQTSEGLGIGDTIAQAKAAYPSLDTADAQNLGRALVAAPGNDTINYRLGFEEGVVTTLGLQLADQACYE